MDFRVGIKIVDGADDVFSLRRKELFGKIDFKLFHPRVSMKELQTWN